MEESLPSFSEIGSKVFSEKGGVVYIGGEAVTPSIRSLLRDQAKSFQTTQLWEIMNASTTDEAYKLALIQSTDFDQVKSAKMLHHWGHFMRNIIHVLAK